MYKGLIKNMCGATMLMLMAFASVSAQSNESTLSIHGASPYTGYTLNGVNTSVVGARFDVGALPGIGLRIAPEFASSISSDNADFLVAAGLQAKLIRVKVGETKKLVSYGRVGAGILWAQKDVPTQTLLIGAYGLTLESVENPLGTRLFVEHQGLDMFKKNRLLVGLTWGR